VGYEKDTVTNLGNENMDTKYSKTIMQIHEMMKLIDSANETNPTIIPMLAENIEYFVAKLNR
jgi:hypothetical protein